MSGGVRGAMERGWRRDLLDELHLEHALGAHEEEEERAEEEGSKDDKCLHISPRVLLTCRASSAQHSFALSAASRCCTRAQRKHDTWHMTHDTCNTGAVPTQP